MTTDLLTRAPAPTAKTTPKTVTHPRPQIRTLGELVLEAREIAAETGEVPSQRYLKTALNIGGARAKLVRDKLVAETEPVPEVPEPVPAEPGDEIALGALDAPTETSSRRSHKLATWPLVLLAIPAFVAVWSGWVGLGELAGFGVVHPLPGIADGFSINTAITLPISLEAYGAIALRAWLSMPRTHRAHRFSKWSALISLLLGALGQVAYHLLVSLGYEAAPWGITTAVATLPVAVLGMGAALAHMIKEERS
ncbi:hypothetical protein [Streptosporangium lutulentum]|uniref:ABC transporter permease n=1 Tax=Streptosporangium lutulentum TaxID=1461250 RepID=A0ABT9QNR3_9ACTN|nr:hypothetical protein [Streptosporangium lutulentum]MDP9847554.1 hypothetical protein [Streptosporangium lutulentum]